ncbi:MAG: ABC transporter substrate-binding protein [Ilumatobacteraceae bacterium]|nr:ABC transporter substrate-binding protein [Ilumatobacteraceae bacterium]
MKKNTVRRFGALVVGLSLLAGACGSDDDATTEEVVTEETTAEVVDETGSELAGMKGTTPLVELTQEFKDAVNAFWTGKGNEALTDFNYTAESFDAVLLIALAAEAAGTDGSALADQIVAVSKDGAKCSPATWADCIAAVKAGEDVDFDGFSGPNTMNGNGEPLEASYGLFVFGADNRFDDSLTTYQLANAPESAVLPLSKTEVARKGDGVLKIGGLLPETGNLAFLGAPMVAGVEYAIEVVNQNGGVLGKPVEYSAGDSGDSSTDTASVTVDRLLKEGVDAIIGAASSGVSLTVIDKITAAGVIQFSPANTSPTLTDYADNGLFFRNAPPDDLQGAVLAEIIIADGNQSVYIMALDDAYGTGLANVVEAVLTAAGIEVSGKKIYDPKATTFDAEVGEVVAANPDAIVLITFDEGSRILRTMVENGIGPQAKNVYGVDGNIGNALGENFDAGN